MRFNLYDAILQDALARFDPSRAAWIVDQHPVAAYPEAD